MSAKVSMSGFDDMTKMFEQAADALRDENAIRDIMHEALRPVADEMYARIKKRSSETADDIRIGDEPIAGDGSIAVGVGFSSPASGGRSYVAGYLEYGTSKMTAQPFIRPSYDSTGGIKGASHRVAEGIRVLLAGVLS